MNVKVFLTIVMIVALPLDAKPQGFAGMGADADGYALPDPTTRFTFPEDHGPHPSFRIEWWYVTAVLTGDNGELYGAQWTLFRAGLRPPAKCRPGKRA